MDWTVSQQASAAYKRSATDPAVRKAFDALWARLQLDPAEGSDFAAMMPAEGVDISRVWVALKKCGFAETGLRIAVERIQGPGLPPPWLAFAGHRHPARAGENAALVALGTVDRHGDAKL